MKIMIDAGHGNNTPGKRSPDDSMREHHFNNATANYLAAELKTYGVFKHNLRTIQLVIVMSR